MPLFEPSFDLEPYTYRGENLREIAFPLGGIGTGCVSLDGRGGLRDWEIFGRPNKGHLMEYTFPALWIREEGGEARALALQGPRMRDFVGESAGFWGYGQGRFFNQMDGLPQFESVEFRGTFPFARIDFHKAGVPLEVRLAAFNPFIPKDVRSSSFPLCCLTYRLRNIGDKRVDAVLAWSWMNPVGEMAPEVEASQERALNELIEGSGWQGVGFSNLRLGEGDEAHGTAVLATDWPDVDRTARWLPGEWWDSIQNFWSNFRERGTLGPMGPEEAGVRLPGTVGCRVSLSPGESAEMTFVFGWSFPLAKKYWAHSTEDKEVGWRPFYATEWPAARDAVEEFFRRKDELLSRTLAFEEQLFCSGLPAPVIESVSATASILHSPTVLRVTDGAFWAWEGCAPKAGCCEGSCSHVWNYALTHAHLFPEMQKNMRRADYKYNFPQIPVGEEGAMNFRLALPMARQNSIWHAASDGQLGGVVQLYRDWRLSGDDDYLRELWPSAKRALEFAWVQWDTDRDGLVDGDAHNTYDINFQGPNPLSQFFYLAALRAGSEICRFLGDDPCAIAYQELFEQGSEKTERELWNGEYFYQTRDCLAVGAPKYQHGRGCLSDQVFGQLSASLAGLGYLVDPEKIRTALRSILNYNFRDPLGDHENLQRVYAVADEPGLILCSWPHGGRPEYPFPYSDEVWTGIEYQVASHLALEGMKEEALRIVAGVRKRYDGRRRNPYNEFECGSHYARALASYGLVLAWD